MDVEILHEKKTEVNNRNEFKELLTYFQFREKGNSHVLVCSENNKSISILWSQLVLQQLLTGSLSAHITSSFCLYNNSLDSVNSSTEEASSSTFIYLLFVSCNGFNYVLLSGCIFADSPAFSGSQTSKTRFADHCNGRCLLRHLLHQQFHPKQLLLARWTNTNTSFLLSWNI